ncbi:hypothetical protein PR048_030679 [Dryococelus australis]|uniref:Uncharacterized protein n=1 Tax=Dryococelus australis TaxID=614101 RepID=A0ABQ9GCE8_9NEOP|nr:hypothetical protein PR048_030679 [Dryococelus australis]
MMWDRVVHGICDKAVQEALLRMDNLNLEKVATHCRVWEQSRQQVNLIHKHSEESNSSVLVNAVKHCWGNSITEGEVKQQHNRVKTGIKGKMVNFSVGDVSAGTDPGHALLTGINVLSQNCSGSRKVRLGQLRRITVLLKHYKCGKGQNDPTYPNEWLETIKVENKKLSASVLPFNMFKKVNQQFQVETTKVKLKMLDGIVNPIGKVKL